MKQRRKAANPDKQGMKKIETGVDIYRREKLFLSGDYGSLTQQLVYNYTNFADQLSFMLESQRVRLPGIKQ